MFKCTDEEWLAAMDTDEFKSAQAKGCDAYNRAADRYVKMAKALEDKETERLENLRKKEEQRELAHRQKIKELDEKARRAGDCAQSKMAYAVLRSIVLKKRRNA